MNTRMPDEGVLFMNEILTTKEVAAELRCSKSQVYRLLNGAVRDVPKLPHISLGRKKVVRRSAFEDWKRINEGCIVSDDADSDAVVRAN
jgi:excisionase family DNA binding protein